MRYPKFVITVLILIAFAAFSAGADSISEVRQYQPWTEYDRFTIDQFKRYGPANSPIDFSNIDYPLLNASIFYETNRRRQEYGRGPYKHSDAMERAAFMHSIDMVRSNFFSHDNYSDSRKREPSDRTAIFGGDGAGENIATTFGIQYEAGTSVSSISSIPPHTYNSFAVDLVEGWMQSPGHKANILDEGGWGYEYLGCGAYYVTGDEWHMFYATQNFSYSGKGAGSGQGGTTSGSGSSGAGSTGAGSRDGTASTGSSQPGTAGTEMTYSLIQNNLLILQENGNWVQLDSSGSPLYSYSEDSRDGDYIYLYDNSRDLWLAVPVYGGSLYYKYGSGGSWVFWLITELIE